ncbi:zinc finger BED domain-containing protein 5-like [Palaemon carinicauda]|uniref:zinc finger BED domain-containing protein 5-like n=1 Tax=Palaemon carinicauda TaxID=392227 RepID=UPI0035B5F356
MPKRKYDDKYLDYGFTFLEGRDEQLPQCVICHKTLSNDSMKPHQLKKHLSNVHPEFVGKERQFFEFKANYLKKMRMDQGGKFQTESKAIVHASYAVSLLVAKAKKPHSIGETLIKPCLVSCAGILLGESAVSKMKKVSLSNDTVKSRIFDMSCNIKSQLLAKVKASPVFAIQLDESVDVANLSQLIVFVRYVHDQSIEEDLLFCRPLETTTQAADVMQLVDAFFEEEGLDWGKLVHACTDGAPAMLGARSGFAKLLKQKNPKVVTLHCIIHRKALASRTMTQPLKEALETAIKLVNFVKASALNTTISTVVPGYGIRLRRTAVPHCRSLVIERRHVKSACAFAPRSYTIFGRKEQRRSESCCFR